MAAGGAPASETTLRKILSAAFSADSFPSSPRTANASDSLFRSLAFQGILRHGGRIGLLSHGIEQPSRDFSCRGLAPAFASQEDVKRERAPILQDQNIPCSGQVS